MNKIVFRFIVAAAFAMGMLWGAEAPVLPRVNRLVEDRRNIPRPADAYFNVLRNGYKRQITDQGTRFFDFSRQLRRITGNRPEALNTDPLDEVPNSAWFTNRNFKIPLSLEAIARGPREGSGPDTSGEWEVWQAKVVGFAPGFFIKDARGERYIIKFDPLGYDELSTGAEVITTLFFHAAGYHVPQNFVTVFRPERVRVGRDVEFSDDRARTRNMNQGDLDDIFSLVEKQEDGSIRAHASRFIDGEPIGSWAFEGVRRDDPNDLVPHQLRREVRGLRVLAAWLNHYDTNLGNTFDAYVEEDGRHYVRHYLIDFGSSLGSSVYGPMPLTRGKENAVQPTRVLLNALTLGLWVHRWERWDTLPHPSVGRFESRIFDPDGFKFIFPNQAFADMTARDAYWGAKLVMSFTDEQIDAVVAQGLYSRPETAATIARILRERRDKIGRAYFSRVNPLDRFAPNEGGSGLCFEDLAVSGGLEKAVASEYRYQWFSAEGAPGRLSGWGRDTCLPFPEDFSGKSGNSGDRPWAVSIRTRRAGRDIPHLVHVFVRSQGGVRAVVAVDREG